MTPRERWQAVLKREKPDRMPMDYWSTPEATRKLLDHLGLRTIWQMYKRLHIDRLVSVKPKYAGPRLRPGYDAYGRRYRNIGHGGGKYRECVYHPLAMYNTIDEIEANYTWPTPDLYDYTVVHDQIRGHEEYPIRAGGSEPFLIYKDLRGMEQAYIDLLERPELVHYCLDKHFAFAYEDTVRLYEQLPGKVLISYVAEDFGGQEALLFSRKVIRTFFMPRMKRMIDLAHRANVYAFFHSDGAIRSIIPDMIEAGIDILNPIQWRCRDMDRATLKAEFGDRLILHGGGDNQYTLPFGSVDEVRQETIDNITLMGKGGGFILAPCHNIQVVSPPENIVAFYETGYACGRMGL
jgi:uroporphyrinogen decarboxylase